MTRVVEKGWGVEIIWADHRDYCGKLLEFHKGGQMSMHLHKTKDETWMVCGGLFVVSIIDPSDASEKEVGLSVGQTFHIPPMTIHSVRCLEQGSIMEVSTHDDPLDSYRVRPGDSQKK